MGASSFRDQQIALIVAASTAGTGSDDFQALLAACDLSSAYADILVAVLERGRWRAVDYPVEYVRKSALRAVFRQEETGKKSREQNSGHSAEELGWLNEMADTSDAMKVEGVWRPGGGRMSAWIGSMSGPGSPIKRVPSELRITVEPAIESLVDSWETVNWQEVSKRAGLDEWESIALRLRAEVGTLYRALSQCENDIERKALEAAWKRLERKGLKKVRKVLSSRGDFHKNLP